MTTAMNHTLILIYVSSRNIAVSTALTTIYVLTNDHYRTYIFMWSNWKQHVVCFTRNFYRFFLVYRPLTTCEIFVKLCLDKDWTRYNDWDVRILSALISSIFYILVLGSLTSVSTTNVSQSNYLVLSYFWRQMQRYCVSFLRTPLE